MKPIWTAASAALLAVGALMGSTAASQAGSASASHASKSETLTLTSKAYSRKHRRHRCGRRCGGGSHQYHGGQYDHSGATDLYYGDREYDNRHGGDESYTHYGDDDRGGNYDDGGQAGHYGDDDRGGHYDSAGHDGQYGGSARYDRRVHGPRYRSRRAGYVYKYAGYWYSRKWWVPVRAHSYGGGHLSHGEWCREQYGRYYDPYSNTYRASDGRSYRCIRPKRR